jgi:4'-phosphopantetheinyl transferase
MTSTEPLAPHVVYLITARLDAPPTSLSRLERLLSAEERARAARFRFVEDRHRHVLGRGLLRHFLARTLGKDAATLQFETTSLGKPHLPSGPSFSIAHSGNLVLIGVAREGRLGVDVEAIRSLPDLDQVARHSFAADEVARLLQLAPPERLRSFFRLWSRKEAVLKALGLGVSALESISVSSDPTTTNALLRLEQPGEDAAAWVVVAHRCGDDVEAAIAWDRPLHEVVVVDDLWSE